jgi:hypothetical protein
MCDKHTTAKLAKITKAIHSNPAVNCIHRCFFFKKWKKDFYQRVLNVKNKSAKIKGEKTLSLH